MKQTNSPPRTRIKQHQQSTVAQTGGYWVYMLRCADQTVYTGITCELTKRMQAHRAGRGSKYVFSRQPFQVVYTERRATRGEALQREWRIKQLSRTQKLALIEKGQ